MAPERQGGFLRGTGLRGSGVPVVLTTPVKALALIVFLSAIAGATWGVQSYLGDSAEAQLVNAFPARATLSATADHTVTYAVSVVNRADAARDVVVSLTGSGIEGRSDARTVAASGNATFFVPVQVPAGLAPGQYPLSIVVATPDGQTLRERPGAATLTVMAPAPGFAMGDTADVTYLGRLAATGRVFNTNDPVVGALNIPKTATYSLSPGLLTVATVPRPTVVTGFYEGMLGMQAGETRTVTFGPEKGYGNATTTSREPRDETLEREFVLELETEAVGRDIFDGYVSDTGQGEGTSFEAGENFIFEQGANRWPYRIESINATVVLYRLNVSAGDSYTLYPFWQGASQVASTNETHTVFRTTPTTDVGGAFTMRSYWQNMSAVKSVNETSIVVRHSPPVGHQYQVAQSQFEAPRTVTVQELTEADIVLATPSGNALAGQDLTFDITLVNLRK